MSGIKCAAGKINWVMWGERDGIVKARGVQTFTDGASISTGYTTDVSDRSVGLGIHRLYTQQTNRVMDRGESQNSLRSSHVEYNVVEA